jgi:hypothetical protein
VSRTRLHIEIHTEPGKKVVRYNFLYISEDAKEREATATPRRSPPSSPSPSLALALTSALSLSLSLALSPAQAALREAVAGNHTNGKLDHKRRRYSPSVSSSFILSCTIRLRQLLVSLVSLVSFLFIILFYFCKFSKFFFLGLLFCFFFFSLLFSSLLFF